MTETPVRPRQLVDAPPVLPYRYGLLAAAQVIEPGAGHWEMGVEYDSDGCTSPGVWDLPPDCMWPDAAFTVTLTATTNSLFTITGAPDGATASVNGKAPVDAEHPLDLSGESKPSTVVVTGPGGGQATVTGIDPAAAENTTYTATSPAVEKTLPDGPPLVTGDPFTVYSGVACQALGLQNAAGRARQRLLLTEQWQVERHVWTQQLAADGTHVLTPPGESDPKAVPLDVGIADLEEVLTSWYGGIGTIHLPRDVAVIARTRELIRQDGPTLRTVFDTPVAAGGGYDHTGPPGAPKPQDGVSWIYATGVVTARRGEITIPATERTGALDPATNQVTVVAERTYVVTVDCLRVGVLVNVTPPASTRLRGN